MAKDEKPKTVYWIDNTLYLNITNQCSNSCFFCLKRYKRGVGGFNLKLPQEPSVNQIISELSEVLHTRNWDGLVFCGFGEPTERLDVLLEVARWVRQHYGRPLQIRVDTNGHGNLLNRGRDVAAELKAAGIDKVSVSLNAGGSLLERLTLRKTSLFEFEVPSYRKRRVGLTANHKQSI